MATEALESGTTPHAYIYAPIPAHAAHVNANAQAQAQTQALPAFPHPTLPPKPPYSVPDHASRRHSLPLHFLPPGLWSSNTSSASLVVESEEAARGEHILDEATVAHRISALRQLNGATRSGHRYAKSTGARNSTFSQPVIVRTYSGTARPRSEQRDIVKAKKENGHASVAPAKMDLKMPPVEAFSFKGIMDEIRHGVTEDLERIAEICARSKYSLSNQYEVHMPPHGRGEPFLSTTSLVPGPNSNGGPTLQAIGSDEEQTRLMGRGSRGGRRTKSVAYGTLETIMSSSRSSEEDQSKKKPAAEIAEEVRGRAARKEAQKEAEVVEDISQPSRSSHERPTKHVRSKSATFASVVIDNAQGFKHDATTQLLSPTSLISEPAMPQTSTTEDINVPILDQPLSPTLQSLMLQKPATIQNESRASTLRPELEGRPSILGSISSWLPWNRTSEGRTFQGRIRSASHAEGSLRDLLRSTDGDKKGKNIDRIG